MGGNKKSYILWKNKCGNELVLMLFMNYVSISENSKKNFFAFSFPQL